MHFSTVPVEAALANGLSGASDLLRPLVLVVDDEPVITETLAAILEKSGMAPMTASNGQSALETAALIPPEMLITDFAMPGMDGLDLALEVKRLIPDCDIILFSGQGTSTETIARLRATDYGITTLAKPVHPSELLQHVNRCIKKRRTDLQTH